MGHGGTTEVRTILLTLKTSYSILPLEHIYRIRDDPYGYSLGREGLDLGVMFLLGLMFRVGAYIALKLVNRDKQK
jgi:hypothetical protein